MSSKRHRFANGRSRQPFIMLRHDMIDSAAWRSLSPVAQVLWVHISRRYNGSNNGEVPLSCREAAELLNVTKNTAAIAFEALMERGFIKIGAYSDFRLKLKKSRRWILTHVVCNGQSPTNEWKAWGKS